MPTRSLASLATLATLMIPAAAPACGAARPQTDGEQRTQSAGSTVITQQQIAASGATTAWEALRRTVTNYTFRETGNGTPIRIDHRGRSSMNLSDRPIVLLDGVQLTEIRVLEQIPATDLYSIEVFSGISATTYYGTNANNGVISIRTR